MTIYNQRLSLYGVVHLLTNIVHLDLYLIYEYTEYEKFTYNIQLFLEGCVFLIRINYIKKIAFVDIQSREAVSGENTIHIQ